MWCTQEQVLNHLCNFLADDGKRVSYFQQFITPGECAPHRSFFEWFFDLPCFLREGLSLPSQLSPDELAQFQVEYRRVGIDYQFSPRSLRAVFARDLANRISRVAQPRVSERGSSQQISRRPLSFRVARGAINVMPAAISLKWYRDLTCNDSSSWRYLGSHCGGEGVGSDDSQAGACLSEYVSMVFYAKGSPNLLSPNQLACHHTHSHLFCLLSPT